MEHRAPPGKEKRHGRAKDHQASNGRKGARAKVEYNGVATTTAKPNLAGPPISTDNDFVQKWLAQTVEENGARSSRLNTGKDHREISQQPQADFGSMQYVLCEEENAPSKPQKKRRRHNSSSDSSLLEAVVRTGPQSSVKGHAQEKYRKRESAPTHLPSEHMSENPEMGQPINRRETFEKRPRRKTREDLYEPKQPKRKSTVESREKRPRPKREKRGDRKRIAQKSGEDLMHNFSSESIGRGRITIRPSHGPGLFKNSRISSPSRRRGLPDLASSEMKFLQRQKHTQTTRNEEKPVSKSRAREKRRVERQQDEISTFFKQRRAPLEELAENASTGTISTHMSDEQPTARRYKSRHRREKENTPCQVAGSPERRDPKPSQPAWPSDPECTRRHSHSKQLPNYSPDSPGNRSWKETTCVTWSETQISPIVPDTSSRSGYIVQCRTSQVPDSIWTSIENTGIFKDTGIVSKTAVTRLRESTPPDERPRVRKSTVTSVNGNHSLAASGSTTSLNSTLSMSHGQRSRSGEENSQPATISRVGAQTDELHQEANAKHLDDEVRSRIANTSLISNQNVVEQYGTEFQRQDPTTGTAFQSLEMLDPRVSRSPPMTREQIGRRARVRLPRTTVPEPKASKEETPQDGDEGNHNLPTSLEKVDQTNVLNSTTPTESLLAPDIAPNCPGTNHEYRAKETLPSMQPTFSYHEPIIARPRSTLYTISPEIRYTGTETPGSKHFAAQNSTSVDRSGWMQTSNLRVDSLSTLPTRGPFLSYSDWMASWPSHLSPIAEHSQPDFQDLQQMNPHELYQAPLGVGHIDEQCGETFEDENGEVIQFTEYLEHGLCEEEHATVALNENYIYDIHDEGLEELHTQDYGGELPIALEEWGEQEQVSFPTMEEPELWPGQGNTKSKPQVVEGIFSHNNLDPLYWNFREGVRNEQANNDEESAMRAFWRPHRTY